MSERFQTLVAVPCQPLELSALATEDNVNVSKAKKKKYQEKHIFERMHSNTIFCCLLTMLMLCVTLSVAITVLAVGLYRLRRYRK